MMSAKHTPGPWTYEFDGAEGDGFVVRAAGHSKHQCIVCGELSRDFELDGPEHEQMKADVRVISAAPELLAFAEEFVEAWDLGMAGDSSLLRTARAVVAKATGQS